MTPHALPGSEPTLDGYVVLELPAPVHGYVVTDEILQLPPAASLAVGAVVVENSVVPHAYVVVEDKLHGWLALFPAVTDVLEEY